MQYTENKVRCNKMETNFILETDRLYLVRPSHEYLKELHNIHSDPRTNIYNPAGPHLHINETMEMLDTWMAHWLQHRFGYSLMIEKQSSQMIGMCGLTYKNLQDNTYLNLAYRLSPDYTKRGYTKEACNAMMNYVKNDIKIENQILARTKYNNIASIMTAQSLGFKVNEQFNDFEEAGDVYLFE